MPSRILQQPHREHYEIIQQLLQTAYSKEACRQFELAYESQLNWPRFTYYKDFLVSQELLIPSDNEPTQHYEIAPKGERCLQLLQEIEDDLQPVAVM